MPDTVTAPLWQLFVDFGDALIGLLGVMVGGLVVGVREWWTTRLARRRSGSYAAIRIIGVLEEYADKCIDVVQDDGTAYGRPAGLTSGGEAYLEAQSTQPNPPDYPEDIEWRSLDEILMHRVLTLPNMARSTDRVIFVAADFAHPPDYSEYFLARQTGYARLGLEAMEIASALRKRYDVRALGRAISDTDWNPTAYLRERLNTLTAKATQ